MYTLSEYSVFYSKTSRNLYQYCRDKPALGNIGAIVNFINDNTTYSFKFKEKISAEIGNDSEESVEIMVQMKYLNNFWRFLELQPINCEVNNIWNWYQ